MTCGLELQAIIGTSLAMFSLSEEGDFGLVTGLDWRLTWGSGVVERFVMMTEMTRFLGEFDAMERE